MASPSSSLPIAPPTDDIPLPLSSSVESLPMTEGAALASSTAEGTEAPPLPDRGDGPLLLREWSDPPVAPAVVVETTPDEPGSGRSAGRLPAFSTYPVANLVRDFVRTGLDQMMPPSAAASAAGASAEDSGTTNLSIRSESAVYAAAASAARAAAATQDPYTVSARTVDDINDIMEDGTEYIIVDGDLIAVPAAHHHYTDDGDEYDDDEPALRKKACHKGRVRRGFRKVRKMFSRKKQAQKRDESAYLYSLTSNSAAEDDNEDVRSQQTAEDSPSVRPRGALSPPHSPRNDSAFYAEDDGATAGAVASNLPSVETGVHPVAAAVAAKAASYKRQSSLGESSAQSTTTTSPTRKERRKSKVSWKKQQQQQDKTSPGAQPKTGRRGSWLKYGQSEEDDRKPRSKPNGGLSNAVTGLTPEPYAASAEAANFSTPLMPVMTPIQEGTDSSSRQQSVTASFVGTADETSVLEAGVVLPAAEAFIEGYYQNDFDEKLKRDDAIPASLVPTDTDYKVDKEHAPDVEALLRRAEQDAITDLDMSDPSSTTTTRRGRGKSGGGSVPLSQAVPSDDVVHNDSLKVVLVGSAGVDKSSLARAIRESVKKPRKRTTLGVEVHTWTPSDIRFHLWDVQGASPVTSNGPTTFSPNALATPSAHTPSTPNFGAHPGTQSLFFSSESLYLLVWDLASNNPHTHPVLDDDNSEDEDDQDNDYAREEANKQADRALQEDIQNRVLSWVDRIARRGPRSAILPVAVIPDGMPTAEAQRRCDRLYELLEAHMSWFEGNDRAPNVVLDDSKNILCVNYTQNFGIEQIQETMVAIATDTSSSVFTHVGTQVPQGVVEVLTLIKRVKQDHKLIWLDHILGELGSSVPVEDVINALHFLSSIGEILYFGTDDDEVLSSFVVLSRKWLVSAISCILRNFLKRELMETRRFMNMQCIYSEQQFAEHDVTRALGSGAASNCPLLSSEDAKMLWQSMSFMREAADRYWQLNETSASAPTMFFFLERLLVNCGIFLPLGMSDYGAGAGMERDEVFFVPSLLSQADLGDKDIWTYRNSDSWTTTLCHSWLFRDGAPPELFEHLTVRLLKDLYDFAKTTESDWNPRNPPHRSQSVPLGHASMNSFIEGHQEQAIGSVRIQQVVCWNAALLLKIGTVFPSSESNELRESSVEIFVTIVDQNSACCVASDAMRANMQRVIVSGKGPVGHNGLKLFKGGYRAVIDSVQKTVDNFNNVNMQVICPNCLANGNPRRASTWSWEEVLAASQERSDSTIMCRRGHRVKSNLLSGKEIEENVPDILLGHPAPKAVSELLPSVVLVGLWDCDQGRIRNVGSGFIADKKHGLIVTAGHVLFDMEEGKNFGASYHGLTNAKVVIGVIPQEGNDTAVFRFFGEVVADDVRSNVDACVVRITTRMEQDVDDKGDGCATQPEIVLDAAKLKEENLTRLKMEADFQLEESIRIIGFNQGGEGVIEPGSHILRSADMAKGYICRMFTAALSDDSDDSDSDSEGNTFSPREEIVAMCPTIAGHSGGPCVNQEGMVIGILSRADPVDKNRCYLVPATQLKLLLKRARNVCSRPVYSTRRPPQQQLDRKTTL